MGEWRGDLKCFEDIYGHAETLVSGLDGLGMCAILLIDAPHCFIIFNCHFKNLVIRIYPTISFPTCSILVGVFIYLFLTSFDRYKPLPYRYIGLM